MAITITSPDSLLLHTADGAQRTHSTDERTTIRDWLVHGLVRAVLTGPGPAATLSAQFLRPGPSSSADDSHMYLSKRLSSERPCVSTSDSEGSVKVASQLTKVPLVSHRASERNQLSAGRRSSANQARRALQSIGPLTTRYDLSDTISPEELLLKLRQQFRDDVTPLMENGELSCDFEEGHVGALRHVFASTGVATVRARVDRKAKSHSRS